MKPSRLFIICIALATMFCARAQQVYIPVQDNDFVTIYHPKGDYFFGPDSKFLKEGKWYDEWVVNDHAFVKAEDGRWHIFGITHPEILSDPLNLGIHQGEWASFHALSYATDFKKTLEDNHYDDLSKILAPKDRPGEILSNHAPCIIKKDQGRHDYLYWEFNERQGPLQAILKDNRKLIHRVETSVYELCDLQKDLSETTDMGKEEPESLKELKQILGAARSPHEQFPLTHRNITK